MALGFTSSLLRDDMGKVLGDAVDAGPSNGIIHIYSAPRPATNDSATGSLLATLDLSDPAFSSGPVLTANPITPVSASAAGTAEWFRVEDSTGATVFDGSIGLIASGADLEMNTTIIAVGVQVDINSITITMGNDI